MKLHLSVPSLYRSRCSLRWIWMPDEFTLNLAVNLSVVQAPRLCPRAGTGISFAHGTIARHKLAREILAVTLSVWPGIHIHFIFLSCGGFFCGVKKKINPNHYLKISF